MQRGRTVFAILFSFLILIGYAQEISAAPDDTVRTIDIAKLGSERAGLLPFLTVFRTTEDINSDEIPEKDFEPLETNSFGSVTDTFWLHLRTKNSENRRLYWILEQDYPVFDRIEVYRQQKDGSLKMVAKGGDLVPQSEWEFRYRYFLTELEEEPGGKSDYFIKMHSTSSFVISLGAMNRKSLVQKLTLEQILYGVYFGFMIVMTLYNLFIYISVRDISYLYYVLYVFTFGFFQACILGISFQYLWPENTWLANHSVPASIYTTCAMIVAFTRSFLNTRKNTGLIDYALIFLIVVCVAGILFSLTGISYVIALRGALYTVLSSVILMMLSGLYCLKQGSRPALFYVISWTLFLTGVMIYVLKTFGLLPENAFTASGMFIGSALEVTLLSFALADRINSLLKRIEIKDVETRSALKQANLSNERFARVFENSSDLFFAMDEYYNIKAVNDEMTRALRYKKTELESMNFLELVYRENEGNSFSRLMVMEKLETVDADGPGSKFLIELKHRNLPEPQDFQISFQKHKLSDGSVEILGRAEPVSEDKLIRFLERERITFRIDNYLRNAELISQRLSRDLTRFVDSETLIAVRTCLREMIINAIEHGNLEVSFDDKSKHIQDGNYLNYIEEKRKSPEFKDRTVTIDYLMDHEKIAYRVTDEGSGFDYKNRKEPDESSLSLQHGRGILMTEAVFDKVVYSGRGNVVTLIKYIEK